MSKISNILILGGTGAMGAHLTRILAGGGGKIHVTSRKERKGENGITYHKGNAHDLSFLTTLLDECTWAAIIDFMTYTTPEFIERVGLLLNATKQYVFLSSSRVYANSSEPIKEGNPLLLNKCDDEEYLLTDEYALRKARQENVLRASGCKNWTIVRPYVTFSEIRLQLSPLEKEYWLYRALKGRTIVFSKDLAERVTTFTYGYDVARGIASLIGKDDALGQEFHITKNESHTWNEIFSTYLNVLEEETGLRPKVYLLEKWKPFLGGNHDQVKWDRLYDRQFDTTKIENFIDVNSFEPTLPALSECLRVFIKHPEFKPINWTSEAVKDKLTGEWASITEIPGVRQKLKYYLIRIGLYRRY